MPRFAAERTLLAPVADVWAFVSTAGRLPDWWPGVVGAQDHGTTWTIVGDERAAAGGATPLISDREDREEAVDVDLRPPTFLRLLFARTGYAVELSLEAAAENRTRALLSIEQAQQHETLAERIEERWLAVGWPNDGFPELLLARLDDVCQTGADA